MTNLSMDGADGMHIGVALHVLTPKHWTIHAFAATTTHNKLRMIFKGSKGDMPRVHQNPEGKSVELHFSPDCSPDAVRRAVTFLLEQGYALPETAPSTSIVMQPLEHAATDILALPEDPQNQGETPLPTLRDAV